MSSIDNTKKVEKGFGVSVKRDDEGTFQYTFYDDSERVVEKGFKSSVLALEAAFDRVKNRTIH